MKKLIFGIVALLAIPFSGADAQETKSNEVEFGIANHFSAGVTVGLAGIGFDVATCLTEYVQVRAGASFFPTVSYTTGFSPIELVSGAREYCFANNIPEPDNIDIEAKLGFNTGKVLFDVFPFPKKSSFHVTAGCYFGSGDIITLRNTEDGVFGQYVINGEPLFGIHLGDYNLRPKDDGNLEAGIHVNSFRPYLGVGLGRAVPRKRVGFMVELGVQFWGSPQIYVEGGEGRHNVTDEDLSENGSSNSGGIVKTINSLNVYPTLTFRLCGRII